MFSGVATLSHLLSLEKVAGILMQTPPEVTVWIRKMGCVSAETSTFANWEPLIAVD